jgi:hypothetical protein
MNSLNGVPRLEELSRGKQILICSNARSHVVGDGATVWEQGQEVEELPLSATDRVSPMLKLLTN